MPFFFFNILTSLKLAGALQLKVFTVAAVEVVFMTVFTACVCKNLFIISGDIIRQLQPLNISGNNPNDHLRKEHESKYWLKTFH